MQGIILYPIIVTIGSVILIWIIGEVHKVNARFQKYILVQLRHDLRLAQEEVYSIEIFAERLEELGEFILVDEDSNGLLIQVLKIAVR